MVSFACLGHWYVQLLFAVPSVGTIGFMGRDSMRKRKSPRRGRNVASAPGGDVASTPAGEAFGEPRGPVSD